MERKRTARKKRIQGYIPAELFDWVQEQIELNVFASESHAVTRGLIILREYQQGKWLKQ